MTKAQFALDLLNRVRKEKTPPLARYCTILAIAEAGKPLTSRQIADRLGEPTAITGTIDSGIRQNLIRQIPTKPHFTFDLTDSGKILAATLLTSSHISATSAAAS
jgi:hypothetical protein